MNRLMISPVLCMVATFHSVQAGAQEAPQTTPAASPAARAPAVSRADLAQAYIRIDRLLSEHPVTGEQLAHVNRTFDRASLKFFANRFAEAVSEINQLTCDMMGDPSLVETFSLAAQCEPPVYPLDARPPATLTLFTRLPQESSAEDMLAPIRMAIVQADGTTVFDATVERNASSVVQFPPNTAPGVCTILAVRGDGTRLEIGRWPLVASRLEPIRRANAQALEQITTVGRVRAQAIASCAARNRLLVDAHSPTTSAQFLSNPAQLQREVASEIGELNLGQDPYLQRDGDTWRVLTAGETEIPFRVYASPARDRGAKLPLVIALHGAGGDENMFFEAYGQGAIRTLAEAKGFILVSPLTYPIAGDASLLDALIDEITTCYTIDHDRIYLIGHSLGAGAAMGLAMARADRIAAACCIAGGGVPRSKDIPPMLVIAAELDALAGPGAAERGAAAASKARASGVPVEYRIMKDWGHTLVVGAALPDAIDWLLQRTLTPR